VQPLGKIVSSLIEDVITPMVLQPALKSSASYRLKRPYCFGTVKYGVFLSAVINFIIVAWVLFMVIKGINAAKKKELQRLLLHHQQALVRKNY